MKKFFAEFKAFIKKGNVVDLAVAMIIGTAFNKIVSSLVNDVIMPLVSLCVGGTDVTEWKWVIQKAQYDAAGTELVAETALRYGIFIQAVIDFLIIALTVFIIVKVFKASRERVVKIGKTIITETTELTKKQIKQLKKLQKKAKKNGEEVDMDKLVEEVKQTEVQATTDANVVKETDNKPIESKPVEAKPAEQPKVEEKPVVETAVSTEVKAENVDKDAELLSVLKEIRDSLKSSNK